MMCESSAAIAGFVVLAVASFGVLLYLAYTIYDSQKLYKATMNRIANWGNEQP